MDSVQHLMSRRVGKSANGYSIRVLRSLDEIETIRSFWEEQQGHPEANIDVFAKEVELGRDVVSPHAVLALNSDQPVAMVVGIVTTKRIIVRISHGLLSGPILRTLTIRPDRVFGSCDDVCCHLFVSEFIAALRRKEVELVEIVNCDQTSSLFQAAKRTPRFLCRDLLPEKAPHWKTVLPENLDELLKGMGPKQRHDWYRKERRMRREFGSRIQTRCFTDRGDVAVLCDERERVARKSIQRLRWPSDAVRRLETEAAFSTMAECGSLRGFLLYIDEQPCAFYVCYIHRGVLHFHSSGFDLRYREWSPGVVLLKQVLEHVYKHEPTIKEIDWSAGDQRFKRHLGNRVSTVGSICIYAPTLFGAWLNCARSAVICAKAVLKRFGWTDAVRTYLRDRAIERQCRECEAG